MNLDSLKIEELNKEIASLEIKLKNLSNERSELLEAKLEKEKQTKGIEYIFFKWASLPINKKDHEWIVHVKTSKGRDLFDEGSPIHPDRYQKIDLERITEIFKDILSELKRTGKALTRDNISKTDVHEWMEGLMKIEYGSSCWDW